MNKFFLLALFALIAVAAAAPAELGPRVEDDSVPLESHDQDKRAILYRTPSYRFLSGYDYPSLRYGLNPMTYPNIAPVTYPDIAPLTYPYYRRYII